MDKRSIELEPLLGLSGSYGKARYFYNLVVSKEYNTSYSYLTEEEAKSLSWYYHTKHNNIRQRFFSHRHAQRVEHLINAITQGTRVLDAGCGFGSESILCGIVGAQVVGVDLIEPWLNIARKRLKFYESLLGRSMAVEFRGQSVLDMQESFDIIWSMESISHIDPAERFVSFAYDHLHKGGRLIISDPNKLNPLIYFNAWKSARRAGGLHQLFQDPRTGEMVPITQEKVFTVFSMKKLLLSKGFVIESVHHSGLLPYLPHLSIRQNNITFYLEKLVNPIWPRWLSGIYTIVATKS